MKQVDDPTNRVQKQSKKKIVYKCINNFPDTLEWRRYFEILTTFMSKYIEQMHVSGNKYFFENPIF